MSLTQHEVHPATKAHLLKRIITSLKEGTLDLPIMPEIALKVRTIVNDENLNLSDLVRLVQQDPSLSAYLIKVSLSSHYNRRHSTNNLISALRRLGLDTTRDLTASYALKMLFELNDTRIKQRLRTIWRRCTYTASLAHVIARYCGFDPGRALLAGLLQEIGALPLLTSVKDYPNLLSNDDIDELLDDYTAKVSGIILNHWRFDSEIVQVGLERNNWLRNTAKSNADLVDLILVARHLSEPNQKDLPLLSSLPAFQKLGLAETDPQQGIAFLNEAQQEIDDLRNALQ